MAYDPGTAVTTPTDIEDAAVAEIVRLIEEFRKVAVQKGMRFIFNNPAVTAVIYKSGEFQPVGQQSYWVPCELHVQIQVSSAKSETDRRDQINRLVMLVLLALMHKSLGLKLKSPGLVPKNFSEVTGEEDFKNNFIIYDIEFAVSFAMEKPSDASGLEDFASLALQYFLVPGDDAVDAEDVSHSRA